MSLEAKRIPLKDTNGFQKPGFSGQVYVPSDAQAGFNTLLVNVQGRHPRKRMLDTTRMYFVVEGSGTFTIDATKYEVEKGDLFIIPSEHEYEYEGEMKLFEVNISPENSFRDQNLE